MADKQQPEAELPFEKALERLETIVAEMESGKHGLEKMMEQFEEGTRLVRLCSSKLDEVERKIEVLVKKGGNIVAKPFDPDASPPAD